METLLRLTIKDWANHHLLPLLLCEVCKKQEGHIANTVCWKDTQYFNHESLNHATHCIYPCLRLLLNIPSIKKHISTYCILWPIVCHLPLEVGQGPVFLLLFDYINLGWRSTACLFKLLGLPRKNDACCATKQHGIPQVNRSHLGRKRDIHSGFALVESERLKQHSHTRVWWINIFRLIPYYIFGLRNMEIHGGSIWLSISQSEVPTQFNFLSPWIALSQPQCQPCQWWCASAWWVERRTTTCASRRENDKCFCRASPPMIGLWCPTTSCQCKDWQYEDLIDTVGSSLPTSPTKK